MENHDNQDALGLARFQAFLAEKRLARENQIPHLLRWVQHFLGHGHGQLDGLSADTVLSFRRVLENEMALQDWQVRQAENAVAIYLHQFLKLNLSTPVPDTSDRGVTTDATSAVNTWPVIVEQARTGLRLRHYSYRTEQTYLVWIRELARYIDPVTPADVKTDDVKHFLTHLAVKRQVSASTQNQAFSALLFLFLFRHILHREMGDLSDSVRAKRGEKLPVVLSREEVKALLDGMTDVYLLMARLIYGAGLRVSECLRLRVKDLDFGNGTLFVRSGKGDKDRSSYLPKCIEPDLHRHLSLIHI